jgi:hypothetical protein
MLEEMSFGNPTQQHLVYIAGSSPFDKHIEMLKNYNPPLNVSKATKEELNELVDYVAATKKSDELFQRYATYDESIEKFLALNIIQEMALDEKSIETIDKLLDYSYPFIYKLKYHFQRPRPYQIAQYYKLKMFPFYSLTAASPSYPILHAFVGGVIFHVLGNHYPDKYDYFKNLGNDIATSRLYLGLNYQSDIDMAMYCVEMVTKDKVFKAQFGL